MNTNVKVVYSIVTQVYQLVLVDNVLYLKTKINVELTKYDLDEDPAIDHIADDITEAIIELATFPIESDGEVAKISQEIYQIVHMFVLSREMQLDRMKTYGYQNK